MLKFVYITIFAEVVLCSVDPKDFGPKLSKIAGPLHDECRMITGATEEEIVKMRNGDSSGGIKIKRYWACTLIHSGVMDRSLHGNLPLMAELEPPQVAGRPGKTLAACAEKAKESGETDLVELALEAMKCAYKADPESFIMV